MRVRGDHIVEKGNVYEIHGDFWDNSTQNPKVAKLLSDRPPDSINGGSPEDYFVWHVTHDLQKVKEQVKLDSISKTIKWFKAVQSRMADMMMNGEKPDASSGLYLDRTIFANPDLIISEGGRDEQILCSTSDSSSLKAKLKSMLEREKSFSAFSHSSCSKEGLRTAKRSAADNLLRPSQST